MVSNDATDIILIWHILSSEAQKKAEVAAIEYEQKIKEKESMKKMSSIEGMYIRSHDPITIGMASFQQIRHT